MLEAVETLSPAFKYRVGIVSMVKRLIESGLYPAGLKLGKIPFLETFVTQEAVIFGGMLPMPTVMGWGAKRTGRRARFLGKLFGIRTLFIEDGFLRSFGTGGSFPPLSMIVDGVGIYYSAVAPSMLENFLNSDTDVLAGFERDIIVAKKEILAKALSKYNHAPPSVELSSREGFPRKILVVDQTRGDLSISHSGAGVATFEKMLLAAQEENPDASIYIKTHPDVIAGKKSGHYAAGEENKRTKLLSAEASPLSLIEQMDHVYVVSSTMGFEALLAGKPVTCFGVPWYSGWGVTDDRVACPRRTARRSVDELFAAAYLRYARYLDPVTCGPGNIFDVINWLVRQKTVNARLHGSDGRGRLICIGFRRWKRANIAPILALEPERVVFVNSSIDARRHGVTAADKIVWWGATAPEGAIELAQETKAGTLQMEDGFIRSVGLGSDLIAPYSVILDSKGLYFDPRQPSDLENILSDTGFSEDDIAFARKIRALIVKHGVTKYNMEPRDRPAWQTDGRKAIFVPGQVEDDASIRFGCSDIRTNSGLLQSVRVANPEAFIVYKPHPDVMSGNRKGRLAIDEARKWADHIETATSVVSCIEVCDEVHVMTSLTGFDALLREKKVVTYGEPFYAGWGLTEDRAVNAVGLPRRKRKLSLDELVSGVLVHYPIYWDPVLKGYTDVEAVINRIVEIRDRLEKEGRLSNLRFGYFRRLWRKAKILTASLYKAA